MLALIPVEAFTKGGNIFLGLLLILSVMVGVSAVVNLWRSKPVWQKSTTGLLTAINIFFVGGFLWLCWFHWQIYQHLPLELPDEIIGWANQQLENMNRNSAYGMPLYNPADPPRYKIPLWIENEKYYFWFLCYAVMALAVHLRIRNHRYRAILHLFLAGQTAILFFLANPFGRPLERFFNEIGPWYASGPSLMYKAGYFMRLYPKMIFYYNAEYMWFHPPLLFISYACITIVFISSVFMLFRRDLQVEKIGYEHAKLGFFMLTLGMLLGYPWALKAWGPNWWWDPKICSSLMMWAVFSTYLHTRLYANKKPMWYFTSILGIICFAAMIFTFLASFYFPGEHTFQ
ncbi:MAG: cytochrome c biogenesis protein CcsA [Deltaproteobacteria bacterium]|nr:cytochrome c biogenesis protein CcsA [Deltaproteobacteria bacterium]